MVGSLNVLEGARQAEAERVVFAASGGTLYGEPADEDLPVRESHPQQPLSPYGVSKKAVIDYLVAYRELHSLEFCALALGNVYGPRQNPHGEAGVVAIFADRVLRGEPVTIFGDGEQTRDYVFVDDVVDAFVRAATRGGGLVCNIGTAARRRSMSCRAPWPRSRAKRSSRSWRRCGRASSCGQPRRRAGGDPARVAFLDAARRRGARRARVRARASRGLEDVASAKEVLVRGAE